MNPIISYYNSIAKDYDSSRFDNSYCRFIDGQERIILRKLLKFNENEKVLDLACGTGRFLLFATHGADASEKMLSIAKRKFANIDYQLCDAKQTPYADNTFDTIICFHLFMHLDYEKMKAILTECSRILKPNGRMIFDIPSAYRRQRTRKKIEGWHGAYSCSLSDLKKIDKFTFQKYYGIMFLPIHHFPKKLRSTFMKFDLFLANYIFKKYSSYWVVEMKNKI